MSCLTFLEPLPPHLGWALMCGGVWGGTWGLPSVRQGMRLLTEWFWGPRPVPTFR